VKTAIFRDGMLLTAYCALIFALSHQPALPVPMLFPHQDKVHHLLAYAAMGLLAWRLFAHRIPTPQRLWLATTLFCSLYGASDEFHQSFISGRESDIFDWLADTLGAAIAAAGMARYLRKFNPKPIVT